jgi:Flp pilus assembly protein TadD
MVVLLVPVAFCGCRSIGTPDTPPPVVPAAGAAAAAPALDAALARSPGGKTKNTAERGLDGGGFQKKLTREQEFGAHLDLGRFQESQENYELALGEYIKALEICDSRAGLMGGAKNTAKQALAHRRMGSVLDRLGRFEQAELEYRAALKLSPNDPKVWNDAGYSYYLQGRWADSERALKSAAKLDPNNSRIMTNLGLTLAASGKPDAALAEFTRAAGPAVGHANLAYILAAMGNTAEAQKHYRRALDLQPELEPAKTALVALNAQIARATQIASAATPSGPTSSLVINKPGALPAVAYSPPISQAPRQAAPAVRPTSYPVASNAWPTRASNPAPAPAQASPVARVTAATPTPTDNSVKQAAAPAARRPAQPLPPLPVPAPAPLPGPVPPFVPPAGR